MIYLRLLVSGTIVILLASLVSIYPGHLSFDWLGYRASMPIGVFFALLLVLLATFLGMHRLWSKLWKLPQRYAAYLQKMRTQKGQQQLLNSITAIAAGQPKEAQEFSDLARELIPDNPMLLVLGAQAAQQRNDLVRAEKIYHEMLENPHLHFLGLKGLVQMARQRGDWLLVHQLLTQVWSLRPDSPWAIKELCQIEVLLAYFNLPAGKTQIHLQKYLQRNVWQRHEAAILWCRYKNPLNVIKEDEVHYTLNKVHSHAPDWVEPALSLAQHYLKRGQEHKAQRVIMTTYKLSPHRAFARIWQALCKKPEDPLTCYRFMEELAGLDLQHFESQLILTQAGIPAKLWGQVETHIEQLSLTSLNQTVCRLWAQYYETVDGDDGKGKAAKWWVKASQAPLDCRWQCRSCKYIHEYWDVVCNHCYDVDTIVWADPSYALPLSRKLMDVIEMPSVKYLDYQEGAE